MYSLQLSLYMKQKAQMAGNFNCLIKTQGLLKVTIIVVIYQEQCKTKTLLLQTTNKK